MPLQIRLVATHDQGAAFPEFLGEDPRKIALWRKGGGLHNRHIILIEAGRRQNYSPLPAPIPMLDYCVYLLYRAGWAVATALPIGLLFVLGQGLGWCAWLFASSYRRLALQMVRIAFAREKSEPELRRLVRRHFQNLGANLLSGIKLSALPSEKAVQRITIENVDAIHHQLRNGRPVLLVLSHLSNWELIAQLLPRWVGYVRNGTVYQKLGNPYIDAHVRAQRGRAGVELFDRREGFHGAIELLRGGGVIGILSDQHAGDHGLWAPFFGRLASTTPLPALLAKRTGAALIGVGLYTSGRARWRLAFTQLLIQPGESIPALTARTNELIAQQIRTAPADWFWVHNRWKTPRPNFLLSKYKRGVFVPPDMPAENLQPFRMLVRAPNWLGDAVMSVPVVRAIKAGRPDMHLTVAAPAKLAALWQVVPEVDTVLAIPERSLAGTVRSLGKEEPFDAAIVFPNSLRAALEVWLARIPRRIGFRGHRRSWLLNQIVPERKKPGPIEHQTTRYLRIVKDLGGEPLPTPDPLARALNQSSPRKIALCPGAEYGPAKRWLPERFAETATAISQQQPVEWILFGTAKDAAIGQEVARALGDAPCTNRIGQTTLTQLIDELRTCAALLTNDTGTMHLASLLGVRVVAVFGSTEPRLTGPLGSGHVILRHQVECSPCFLRECPIDFRCMKAVTAAEATAALLSVLK